MLGKNSKQQSNLAEGVNPGGVFCEAGHWYPKIKDKTKLSQDQD